MSGGKKKRPKARMISEGEFIKRTKNISDEAAQRIMLICLAAARDEFDLDDDGLTHFMETMQRYIKYQSEGKVDLIDYGKTIRNRTGIDLHISRW